jgi:hypothetical protein
VTPFDTLDAVGDETPSDADERIFSSRSLVLDERTGSDQAVSERVVSSLSLDLDERPGSDQAASERV